MKETVDVDDCLRRGDFIPINDWNRKHIWRSGCLYRPGELFEKVICGSFDPTVYRLFGRKIFGSVRFEMNLACFGEWTRRTDHPGLDQ